MPETECLFCNIAAKKIPAKMVFKEGDILAFEDIRPQAPTHIIIIPKRHIEKVSDLKKQDRTLVGDLILAAKEIAREKGIDRSGYRLVMNCGKDSGQAVPHLHLHLLGGRPFAWPPG